MRLNLFRILFTVILICGFSLADVQGQSYDDDDRPVLKEEFCILLKKVISAKAKYYATLADSLEPEEMQKFTELGYWPVREDASFVQARRTVLVGSGTDAAYITIFMSRDTKDGLVASFNNVLSMVKDCLYFDYTFEEAPYMGVKGAAGFGLKSYEYIGKPLQINADYPPPIIHLKIEKNRQSAQYDLVLVLK